MPVPLLCKVEGGVIGEKLCLKEEAPKGRKRGVSLKQPCETFPAVGGESSLQGREAVIWALLARAGAP